MITTALLLLLARAPDPDLCVRPAFFARYFNPDLELELAVRTLGDGRVELTGVLPVNLHEPDCTAPDAYGTQLKLRVRLHREGSRCILDTAELASRPFNLDEATDPGHDLTPTRVEPAHPDLASLQLRRVVLRDEGHHEALSLSPRGWFFFEQVGSGTVLRDVLGKGASWNGAQPGFTDVDAHLSVENEGNAVYVAIAATNRSGAPYWIRAVDLLRPPLQPVLQILEMPSGVAVPFESSAGSGEGPEELPLPPFSARNARVRIDERYRFLPGTHEYQLEHSGIEAHRSHAAGAEVPVSTNVVRFRVTRPDAKTPRSGP